MRLPWPVGLSTSGKSEDALTRGYLNTTNVRNNASQSELVRCERNNENCYPVCDECAMLSAERDMRQRGVLHGTTLALKNDCYNKPIPRIYISSRTDMSRIFYGCEDARCSSPHGQASGMDIATSK